MEVRIHQSMYDRGARWNRMLNRVPGGCILRREDRISGLPDEIIHEILSLMPTNDAVRTSCLSKRWRNLWKFSPVIEFASPTYSHPTPDCLLSQQLREFIIAGKFDEWSDPAEVEEWLDCAISKKVRNLELCLFGRTPIDHFFMAEYLRIPASFYGEENMAERVVLSCVDYSLPKGFNINNNCWCLCLKKLFLYDCMVNESDLESTVSNSMFLESLILVRCEGLTIFKISSDTLKELVILPNFSDIQDLEINAPNLLSLTTKHLVVSLRLTNCCRLVRALFQNLQLHHSHRRSDLQGLYIKTRELLSQLHHLEFLGTNHWLTFFLDQALYKNGERWPKFNNLKELYFLCYGMTGCEILLWLNFLRDCPFLNKIQLDFGHGYSFPEEVHLRIPHESRIRTRNELMITEMYPDFEYASREDELKYSEPLYELKSIELFRFIGSRKQMEMVKRLLKKAPNLETLSLIYNRDSEHNINVLKPKTRILLSHEDRILLLQQVSQLPRPSLDVKFLLD